MSFTSLFYQHIMFRRSCEKCHFTNLQRPSDITLADFWGWKKINSSFNSDNKGVSLVFCNTEKGLKLFDEVKEKMEILPVDLEDALQPNLQHPTIAHPKREEFEELYVQKGFLAAYRRFGEERETISKKTKRYLRFILNHIQKLFTKKNEK